MASDGQDQKQWTFRLLGKKTENIALSTLDLPHDVGGHLPRAK